MIDRNVATVPSRERLRNEIARDVEQFLRRGGNIERVPTTTASAVRPVGAVWWDARGGLTR